MISFWQDSGQLRNRIYIPKYYDPEISNSLNKLRTTHELFCVKDLVDDGTLSFTTGDEIGKLAYGTGDIPFVRTSDISNWEIRSAPKQGVSEEIYQAYADAQDVRVGDILLVRDGTYLIGSNCIVTALDQRILYQSHILKIRVNNANRITPNLLFLILNSEIVQRQLRSFQFTADTIDTVGNRYLELVLPIPIDRTECALLDEKVSQLLEARERGKAFIRQAPLLIEAVLKSGTLAALNEFRRKNWAEICRTLTQETITTEFGSFETFWHQSKEIKNRIYLPKYYDPEITEELASLSDTCDCVSLGALVEGGLLQCTTGDEIGKMAYGTGTIPFVRTSDFANWEIKHDPKQGVSEEIYEEYAPSQDVKQGDILLVRDGTYLVGTSCIVLEEQPKMLFCGGLYKLRSLQTEKLNAFLLLGLLNSYIIKRQIRSKQFTRDVIDTLGKRLFEVIIPIPKRRHVRAGIARAIEEVVRTRIGARVQIGNLTRAVLQPGEVLN